MTPPRTPAIVPLASGDPPGSPGSPGGHPMAGAGTPGLTWRPKWPCLQPWRIDLDGAHPGVPGGGSGPAFGMRNSNEWFSAVPGSNATILNVLKS